MAALFPAEAQSLRAYPLPLGGAVAQRLRGYKWRSEKSVKAIAPTGAALAFVCFDFFFRFVNGVQPLTRCGAVSYTHLDVYKRQVHDGDVIEFLFNV